MAREEQDREDLLGEATALVERGELEIAGQIVFVGFRPVGAASLYFGPEPAYHFTSAGALRRAFVDGRLFKAERGRLVALTRQRSDQQVALVRHELTAAETEAFLGQLSQRLEELQQAIANGTAKKRASVPAEWPMTERVADWLHRLPRPVKIAHTARVQ